MQALLKCEWFSFYIDVPECQCAGSVGMAIMAFPLYWPPNTLPPSAENHHGLEYPRRRRQLRSLPRRQEDRPLRHRQGGRLSRRPRLFRVDRHGRPRRRGHAGAAIGLRLARAGRRGCAGRARAAQAGRVRRHPVHGDAHGHPGRRRHRLWRNPLFFSAPASSSRCATAPRPAMREAARTQGKRAREAGQRPRLRAVFHHRFHRRPVPALHRPSAGALPAP